MSILQILAMIMAVLAIIVLPGVLFIHLAVSFRKQLTTLHANLLAVTASCVVLLATSKIVNVALPMIYRDPQAFAELAQISYVVQEALYFLLLASVIPVLYKLKQLTAVSS